MRAPALAPLLLLAGCAGGPTPQPLDPGHPAGLVATEEIRGDFLIRQQLHFRFGDHAGTHEAVIQKHCNELTVVGLTPFGSPAFVIRQRGLEVSVESHLPGPWPFEPRHVLLDVHRIYLLPILEPAPQDGVRETRRGGETLVERWASGRLVERSFHSAAGHPPGRVVVTYPDGAARGEAPPRARLENERYGYAIDVITLSRSELDCIREAEGEASADRWEGENPWV